jgi:hypothetical protein
MDQGLVAPDDYRGMHDYVLADGSTHRSERLTGCTPSQSVGAP